MPISFPGESAEYRAARDHLLEQELELRRAMEAVAAARRQLPPGGIVPQDYVFQTRGSGGDPVSVRLSELFASGKDSLVIYSMMFPRAQDDDRPELPGGQISLLPKAEWPCASCTAFVDQLDGAAEHASQHINLAVAAKRRSSGSSHSPPSAAGGGYALYLRRAPHTTRTTSPRPPMASSSRC